MKVIEKAMYELALKKWGTDAQIGKAIEEMAELIVKLIQRYNERVKPLEVVEEIADVQIMMDQLEILYKQQGYNVAQMKLTKLDRLKTLLEK